MKNLSVVIPVFNALDSLKLTLDHLIFKTVHLKELIIVDDHSDEETEAFIDGLRIDDGMNIRLIKTRNPRHSWTNASWNMGVSLSHGDYIAILNSDITVSDKWDVELMKSLDGDETSEGATIACPWEDTGHGLIRLDPVIEKVDPGMLKGACFMFKRQDIDMFPIDSRLAHWCGDNYLADEANKRFGVWFASNASITHGVTHSGRLIDPKVYNEICKNDVLTYQKLSGRDMSLVLKHFK